MPPRASRRTGLFHRESTRLRSNVADQVQRDLLPAGRLLSVFLVLCELLAEVAVLIWSRGQKCDRPLRFWVTVLIMLQASTVLLNCLNIWYGRDTFGQHRNGLSASDLDMYTDSPASAVPSSSSSADVQHVSDAAAASASPRPSDSAAAHTAVVVTVSPSSSPPSDDPLSQYQSPDTEPLIGMTSSVVTREDQLVPAASDSPSAPRARQHGTGLSRQTVSSFVASGSPLPGASSGSVSQSSSSTVISTEFVDRYVRIVNAWYLIWFILGSVWVSDGGECSKSAPHLYRLIVALTIIYYALLFLPLACFCLIVCCLPLFILVYRIMLPYAERERRRARAADPAQVQNLSSIAFSTSTFASHTGNDSLEDASCVICLCEYEPGEIVRFLPCKHHFHKDCVDVWLRLDKACCLCKQDIDAQSQPMSSPV